MQNLFIAHLVTQAESRIRELNGWNTASVGHANTLGVVQASLFNNFEEAETDYRKAIELDQTYAFVWNGLGIAFHDQGCYTEAAYRKAIELDSHDEYAWSNIAGLYLFNLKQNQAGIAALLQGLSLNPKHDYGRYVLASFWQQVLPVASEHIADNTENSDNLCAAITEELLLQASHPPPPQAVLEALQALDESQQAIFEPLLLALQAINNRDILYRVAREKRELALDVLAQIASDSQNR